MPDNKLPSPSDILGSSKLPSPSDILGGEVKKKSTSQGFGIGSQQFGTGLNPSQPISPSVLNEAGTAGYEQGVKKEQEKKQKLSERLAKNSDIYNKVQGTALADVVNRLPVEESAVLQGKKERSYIDKAMDAINHIADMSGYVASGLNKGISNIVSGAAIGAAKAGLIPGTTVPTIEAGMESVSEPFMATKEQEKKYGEAPIISQLHGLAEFIPASIAAESTGGATFFLNGYGSGLDEVKNLERQGAKFENGSDDFYALGRGLVDYLLMSRLNSHTIFSKLPSSLRGDIAGKISMDALGDVAKLGEKATADDIVNLFKEKAIDFDSKLNKFGSDFLKSYANTAVDLTALNAANFGLGKITNKVSGQENFKQTPEDLINGVGKILTIEAPIFAGFGAVRSAGQLFRNSPYTNEVVKSIYKDSSPENVDLIKRDLSAHLEEKGLSPEEIQNSVKQVDTISEIAKTLPNSLTENKLKTAIELIQGREQLRSQLQAESENKSNLDESLRDIKSPGIDLLNAKLEQANDKLKELATDTKYKFVESDGSYFKVLGDNAPEQISKDRYELENLEKEFKEKKNAIQEQSTESEVSPIGEAGQNIIQSGEGVGQGKQGTEITKEIKPKEEVSPEVDKLRVEEQDELRAALPNAENYITDGKIDRTKITDEQELAKFDEIYDKYDKLITALLKESKQKTPEESVSKLQTAKDRLAAAKERLSANKINFGVSVDPKQKAKDLFEYHSAIVDVAKEYISQGVKDIKTFAKEIGEKITSNLENAWNEANGGQKKELKDFIDIAESELIGITKKDVKALREDLGEEQFEYETQTRAALAEKAKKKLDEGFDVRKLVDNINEGTKSNVSDSDVELMRQYYASLTAKINENPTPELLAERKRLMEAIDASKVSAGRAVQAFDGLVAVEDNLASFLADESKYSDLTKEEIKDLTEKYNQAKVVNEKLKNRIKQLEEETNNAEAQENVNIAKNALRKANLAAKKSEFKKEREIYIDEFRKKLKEIRSGASSVVFPYQRELIELAPFVRKMVKSYVSEGVVELKDIVADIHDLLKNDIDGLTESDVRDVIAGKYVNTRNTKNAKMAQIVDLEKQAKLELEIENLENGILKEKNPVQKRVKSDKILELERQIKEIKKRNPDLSEPSRLEGRKTWFKNKIEQLKNDIKTGDFDEIPAPRKIILDDEALALKDEYNKFLVETRERRAAKEYQAKSKIDKALDRVQQVLGLKRLIQTSIDLSIPLRQGVSVMFNPRTMKIGSKGYVKMIKSLFDNDASGIAKFKFSDKFYNRMMSDIETSPEYSRSKEDGVVYTELGAKKAENRDESHPTDSFLYDIPYLSAPFKASERAAAAWTNYTRYQLYLRGAKFLLEQGKTRENSPKAYEDLSARIMVDTGRGKIPGVNDKGPNTTDKKIKFLLGNTFYGARLVSAMFRKLDPTYYLNPKIDKTVRVEAFKDMAGYVTSQVLFHIAAASALGATVSLDYDDPDFLKLRLGKRVLDLTAGQSAYIRTFFRLMNAAYNNASPYVSEEDAKKYSDFAAKSVTTFWRNKLAPNTSYALDWYLRENSIGEKFDQYDILKLYPMYGDDLMTAINDGSPIDAAILLPIGISGLSYQEYSKNIRQAKLSNYLTESDKDIGSFMKDNKLNITSDINQELYDKETGNTGPMTKAQSNKFESEWADYVINTIRSKKPELDAIKSDIYSKNPDTVIKLKLKELANKTENKDLSPGELKDKLYQKELKKGIESIKSDANDYAKEIVMGFPKELLKVQTTIDGKRVDYTLTKDEVNKRISDYKKVLANNKYLYGIDYGQYIKEGKTPAEAKKLAQDDIKSMAIQESKNLLLDKYLDKQTGQYKF